ncbi:MAG: YigZ family protein [Pseudomonadota bacterium]
MYLKPENKNREEIEIKKSRFIADIHPADSRKAAMLALEGIRRLYPDANHHCWAYILGDSRGTCSAGCDDDGEPSGMAGRPILNVLKHQGVGDAIVIVTRYFGGIKLGGGGLVRAYSTAADTVLRSSALGRVVAMTRMSVSLPFSQESQLRHWLSKNNGNLVDIEYSTGIAARIEVPDKACDVLIDTVAGLGGDARKLT